MQIKDSIQLVECPRDAMQGWHRIIPALEKAEYLQQLLQVGFHTLDCGSFVSPKAVPQMADTAEVLSQLDLAETKTRLLVIVANERGAETAVGFDKVHYLGYPFSISPTFQKRNTNSSMDESVVLVERMMKLCKLHQKELVVYLSMGFGNPYGDPYSAEWVLQWAKTLAEMGVQTLSLADTVGLADRDTIKEVTASIVNSFPDKTIGVHLHSNPFEANAKLQAAWNAGIRRFDGAMRGIGGCPFANDKLVGNMDTETMVDFFEKRKVLPNLNREALAKASEMAARIFA